MNNGTKSRPSKQISRADHAILTLTDISQIKLIPGPKPDTDSRIDSLTPEELGKVRWVSTKGPDAWGMSVSAASSAWDFCLAWQNFEAGC